jgi:hypothetical protein
MGLPTRPKGLAGGPVAILRRPDADEQRLLRADRHRGDGHQDEQSRGADS